MRLKRKNIGTMIGLLMVIAIVSFWSIGCVNHFQNSSSSDLETPAFETSVSETKPLDLEIANTEPTVERGASTEDISVGDVHLFEREDKISTMFYDLQLDKVTFTDSLGGVAAEDGREFMALDVTLTTDSSEMVLSMYAQEFIMVCFTGNTLSSDREDFEKLYPLEEKLEEGQFDDAWLVTVGEKTKGKLVYHIPKDTLRNTLLVYDSYTANDYSGEVVYGDGYMMTILNENWSREE